MQLPVSAGSLLGYWARHCQLLGGEGSSADNCERGLRRGFTQERRRSESATTTTSVMLDSVLRSDGGEAYRRCASRGSSFHQLPPRMMTSRSSLCLGEGAPLADISESGYSGHESRLLADEASGDGATEPDEAEVHEAWARWASRRAERRARRAAAEAPGAQPTYGTCLRRAHVQHLALGKADSEEAARARWLQRKERKRAERMRSSKVTYGAAVRSEHEQTMPMVSRHASPAHPVRRKQPQQEEAEEEEKDDEAPHRSWSLPLIDPAKRETTLGKHPASAETLGTPPTVGVSEQPGILKDGQARRSRPTKLHSARSVDFRLQNNTTIDLLE